MLTFVIPTIPGRESLLSRCLWSVQSQMGPIAEVLVIDGTGKLGDKLNAAYRAVETEYVAAIDDDDYIAPDYTTRILPRLSPGSLDFVGFQFLELTDGRFNNVAASKGDYPHWGMRTRPPSPKCPVRTSIARKVRFGNDYKADRRWASAVHGLVGPCDFIERPLYIHDWWGGASSFHRGEHRDVGEWPHDPTMVTRMTVDDAG